MIAKTRTEFPFKVSTKRFSQNYFFQESSRLLFSGSSPNYWTHGFPVNAFLGNFRMISFYAEDIMVLQVLTFRSFGRRLLQYIL